MELKITGATSFLNRMSHACGRFQWAREFLVNALEAGARRVEFGIEWQAVAAKGVHRRTICDDGCGMDARELAAFFGTLGAGGKAIGGLHDNFGVGAKIAALAWNPSGMVVISYKRGVGAMVWLELDEATGEYHLVEFEGGSDGLSCATEPSEVDGIDWAAVAPDWVREHGTAVVLLGSPEAPDTVLGNPEVGESDIKGLSSYLNSRFWSLAADVHVVEVLTAERSRWPRAAGDGQSNTRQIRGASHYLESVKADNARLAATGCVPLSEGRVQCHWYLWEGERPAVHSYARRSGYIAIRYRGELYELTSKKADFRNFGVIESRVQQNLTFILEPQLYRPGETTWGVHPDQSRTQLHFTDGQDKGVRPPLREWGREFIEQMPDAVLSAIRAAQGDVSGSIDDDAYRKRLQDRFGARWQVRRLVEARQGVPATLQPECHEHAGDGRPGKRARQEGASQRGPRKVVSSRAGTPGGDASATERNTAVDVPRYRIVGPDVFTESWYLAMWVPAGTDGPTVYINRESPILEELVRYHQERRPDAFAEEVGDTVRRVIGEIAACKVAHAQKLTRFGVPVEELNEQFRSEQALTMALMGLLAEEAVIEQRLDRLFTRRRARPDDAA